MVEECGGLGRVRQIIQPAGNLKSRLVEPPAGAAYRVVRRRDLERWMAEYGETLPD